MGLAVQCGVNIHLFVLPKDAARPTSICAYSCLQLYGSAQARKPPTLHLCIANGHFSALTTPNKKCVHRHKSFAFVDISKEGVDPATGGCDNNVVQPRFLPRGYACTQLQLWPYSNILLTTFCVCGCQVSTIHISRTSHMFSTHLHSWFFLQSS